MRSVIVLGSTGSIGTQGLDIIARHCDKFSVSGLSAAGTRPKLLAEQAIKFNVPRVSVFNPDNVQSVRDALDCMGAEGKAVEISSGEQSVSDMASQGADVVLNGITGSVGLKPSIAALQSGSQLALANKESSTRARSKSRASALKLWHILQSSGRVAVTLSAGKTPTTALESIRLNATWFHSR